MLLTEHEPIFPVQCSGFAYSHRNGGALSVRHIRTRIVTSGTYSQLRRPYLSEPSSPLRQPALAELKLVASGEVDATMLEALEDYVTLQKKRLSTAPKLPPLPY